MNLDFSFSRFFYRLRVFFVTVILILFLFVINPNRRNPKFISKKKRICSLYFPTKIGSSSFFLAVVKVIYESGEEEHRFAEEWIVLNLKKRRLLMLYSLSRRRGGISLLRNWFIDIP